MNIHFGNPLINSVLFFYLRTVKVCCRQSQGEDWWTNNKAPETKSRYTGKNSKQNEYIIHGILKPKKPFQEPDEKETKNIINEKTHDHPGKDEDHKSTYIVSG